MMDTSMPDGWVDVCIQAKVDAGELLGMLDDPAVQGAWEENGTIHLYWPERQWSSDRLASLRQALARMADGNVADALLINRVPHRDWNEEWAKSVKPLRIGRL